MSVCREHLREQGKPAPRTCPTCGLGSCHFRHKHTPPIPLSSAAGKHAGTLADRIENAGTSPDPLRTEAANEIRKLAEENEKLAVLADGYLRATASLREEVLACEDRMRDKLKQLKQAWHIRDLTSEDFE